MLTSSLKQALTDREIVTGLMTFILVFILSLILYLVTVAPTLTWAHEGDDGGDLAAAAYTGGVPHPPGYPTYMVAARLAIWLQAGPIAGRTNRLSAFSGALAAGLVAVLAYVFIPGMRGVSRWSRGFGAVLAGLVFASNATFWGQALITEVYTFSSIFLLAVLLLGIRLETLLRRKDSRVNRNIIVVGTGLGFAASLGFGAHATVIFALLFILIFLTLSSRRFVQRPSLLLSILVGGGMGLLIFLIIPGEANRSATSNWGAPSDLQGFLWLVTAEPYHSLVQWGIFPSRIIFLVQSWLSQFTPFGILFAVYGFWIFWETRRPAAIAALLTIGLDIQFTTMYYAQGVLPYLTITTVFLALWFGLGVYAAAQELGAIAYRLSRYGRWAICLCAVAIIAYTTVVNFPQIDASKAADADAFGRQSVEALPAGAVIFSNQTNATFALWYAQAVTDQRPDITVIDVRMLDWAWYRQTLLRFYPNKGFTAAVLQLPAEILMKQLVSAKAPVFSLYDPQIVEIQATVYKDTTMLQLS